MYGFEVFFGTYNNEKKKLKTKNQPAADCSRSDKLLPDPLFFSPAVSCVRGSRCSGIKRSREDPAASPNNNIINCIKTQRRSTAEPGGRYWSGECL